MIAVDTNVLVYADREDSALHKPALQALRKLAEGDEAWAVPVFCVGVTGSMWWGERPRSRRGAAGTVGYRFKEARSTADTFTARRV